MAKKKELDITSLKNYSNNTQDKQTSNIHPNSLKNLHPRTPGKTEKRYMPINVHGLDDYLTRISKYNQMTITAYIRQLIEKDMELNQIQYEALKMLDKYDK